MKSNRSKEYLEYSLKFSDREKVLRQSLIEWLPNKIIDCHVHNGHPRFIKNIDKYIFNRPSCSFPDFTLKQSYQVRNYFYGEKNISMLRFAMPFQGVNHYKLNDYLIYNCLATDRIALYGLADDENYTIRMMSRPEVSALKMHRSFFIPLAKKIYDFFPKNILKEAQRIDLPIILHLPNTASNSIDEVVQLMSDFPRLSVVLAHLGICTEPLTDLERAYSFFSKYKNIYIDTSMVFSSAAIKLSLKYFKEERILYGSDEPFNLLRVRICENTKIGVKLISNYPYHWVSQKNTKSYGNIIHAHWSSILALKNAISDLTKIHQESIKNKIFFINSKKLFDF